jgi:NDP-sugar pyrophosphorylase family protein
MCTGFLGEQIEYKFGSGRPWDVAIEYSKESCPLGTAGALKLAQSHFREATDFLVMNGDSFLEVDFDRLVRFHRERGGMMSMAVVRVENAGRYGTVKIGADERVIGFSEKTGDEGSGVVNAGVYVLNHDVFDQIPDGVASLEKDVFPRILDHGVYALEQHGMFIDIGTPDDYERAQLLCDSLYATAFREQERQDAEVR